MKNTALRTIVFFVYVLTFAAALPAAPLCPCMGMIPAFGADTKQSHDPDCACRTCGATENRFLPCAGGECPENSRSCSGCNNDAKEEFKTGCGCDIHASHPAGEEYIGERTKHPDRVNPVSFAAADITGRNGILPRSVRFPESGNSLPRNDLLHRSCILII
jgi:hypothetical protein